MKRVTSASVAAASVAATQVHHQARVQELFAPGPTSTTTTTTLTLTTTTTTTNTSSIVGDSFADEQDKQLTTISTWLEPKGSPKISPGTNDDNKAKSTAMSRLLAVDSDNYMLRKGAAAATTPVSHGAAAPSSTASSSSQSSSSLNGSASVQLQRQMQSLAIGSAAAPSILATYGNSSGGDHVNVGQLCDVTRTTSRSTGTYASPRWYAGNGNQVTRQHREGTVTAEEQSLQQQQQQLQLQSRAATTSATSTEGVESELGFTKFVCARLVSFHRYMCWCGTQPVATEAVDANSIGDRAKGGKSAATPYEGLAARRTVRDDSCNSSSLCCCMCGSLCPAECHACFHIVCSDYSSQHLCQWSTKGHALPGQVHDKDKVSKRSMPSRYITTCTFELVIR